MAPVNMPEPHKIVVALEKGKLETLLTDAFRKNGQFLVFRKKLHMGIILREAQGSRREGMVSISEDGGRSLLSMPPFFQAPIASLLEGKGVVFRRMAAT